MHTGSKGHDKVKGEVWFVEIPSSLISAVSITQEPWFKS